MKREVILKSLNGRGKIDYFLNKRIQINNDISKVLGAWIIDLMYEKIKVDGDIYLKGSYSLQLWYAKDHDTSSSVYEEKIEFYQKVNMVYLNENDHNEQDIKVYVNAYPSASEMELLENNEISININATFYVDVFEEIITVVDCLDSSKAELTIDEEMLLNVNTNYIEKKL